MSSTIKSGCSSSALMAADWLGKTGETLPPRMKNVTSRPQRPNANTSSA